jgi:hypothetical protein
MYLFLTYIFIIIIIKMQIEDFLPKYPNINNKDKAILNPYDNSFYQNIYRKREFYDEKLEKTEEISEEKGSLLKIQKILSRYMSSNTLYDSLLIIHNMGTGKTCTSIAIVEQIKRENAGINGALVFAKGKGLLRNFTKELRDKCTAGQYKPEGMENLSELEVSGRTNKLVSSFYSLSTFETFAKNLSKESDDEIINLYSNKVIIIDEVHNLRIQDFTSDDPKNKSSGINIYYQFKRFLHLIRNSKIILLSGTPMKDTPEEIASVMNLILPVDEQLPVGENFIKEYLDVKGENKSTVKKNKIQNLKDVFKGRVSFLKSVRSTVKKEFSGVENYGTLKHFIVNPVVMSEFQTDSYMKAVKLDEQGQTGVYYNSRQASLMVFPDGSYGQSKTAGKEVDRSTGFGKYLNSNDGKKNLNQLMEINKNKLGYSLNKELLKAIKGETKELNAETTEIRLENLRKYSAKYAHVISSILNSSGESCFVYSELVTGSGSILFSKLLELFGFSQSFGTSKTIGLRYGFLTSDSTNNQLRRIIDNFNDPINMHGQYIKVLIGSRVVSEGVSFNNVQREYIMTPWFNYSETDQAIARGYRMGSHKDLLDVGQVPVVKIDQIVSIARNSKFSIDLFMYQISEDKDITIRKILRIMMESSMDCALTYSRNNVTGEDGKRDCEYQSCDYRCDGIKHDKVINGLESKEIDDSTYQIFYLQNKDSQIRNDMEKYFRLYNDSTLDYVIKYFKDKYSEWDIKNSLKKIMNMNPDQDFIYYNEYSSVYDSQDIKKIINKLVDMFNVNFSIDLNKIFSDLNEHSNFEILTSLKHIIDSNYVIKNKYGFYCYLREDHNIYFLVNTLSITDDFLSGYYSRIPNIVSDKSFADTLEDVQNLNLPNLVDLICKIKNKEEFNKLIKSVPNEVQELFIESSIQSKIANPDSVSILRDLVIEYFTNYIHYIKEETVSTRLNDVLRCYKDGKWENCEGDQEKQIQEKNLERKTTLEENKWGYYGQYNPESKVSVFSIVNVVAQKEKQAKLKELEFEKLKILVEKNKITQEEMDEELLKFVAGREIYPGKNCYKGWGVYSLMKMSIRILKLDYPETSMDSKSDEELRKILMKDKYVGKENSKNEPIYSKKEINELSTDDLRRAIYWSTRREGGYINGFCKAIEEWFRNTKWEGLDMLIPDKQGGISGGHKKIIKTSSEKKKHDFRIEKLVPMHNVERFKSYFKDMRKIKIDPTFTPVSNDYLWIFIYSNKKMVGYLSLDLTTNIIQDVKIAKNYERMQSGSEAISKALKDIVSIKTNFVIKVNTINNDYKKVIKTLINYGFRMIKTEDKITTLDFKIINKSNVD